MRSKSKTLSIIVTAVLTIMFIFPVSGLPGWLSFGIMEVYAVGGMSDCGPNLSTVYGESSGILSIQVKEKSNPSRSMYNYSDTVLPPWDSVMSSVKSISIHSGVENIGNYAFKNMTSLTEVYIPKSMIAIFPNAFEGCTNLKKVYYGGSHSAWQTLTANTQPGNGPLMSATTIYGDDGEMTYNFRKEGGGSYQYNGSSSNTWLKNTFTILERNDLITWSTTSFFSDSIDLNKDGTNDISCHFSDTPPSYSLAALAESDLVGKTYTFEIDKDMDLLGMNDNFYHYYSKVTFIFPLKFDGDKGSFTLDLVNKAAIDSEDLSLLSGCLNAANNTDSSIICHFSGPITEVDLNKDGSIDLIIDNSTTSIKKAETCSVKETSFTVKLSDSAKNQLNNMEWYYYSTVTFKLSEPEKPTTAGTPTETPLESSTDIYGNVLGTETQKENQILSLDDDKDPVGSSFSLLQAKMKKAAKSSITICWKRVPGATSYTVFGNKCGKGNKYQKIITVNGVQYVHKGLKKGTYYKFLIVANGGGKAKAVSKVVHAATSGGKVGNNKSVKISSKKTVTLKKGKISKIKAKTVAKSSKLKVKKHRKLMFETDNPKVATVNKSGKIKAVGTGSCNIYVYAQDGTFAKVKVKVKK
ncbi:MAG: leucine-rich repeat protein [Lachnospiraceae bacterium]|nr:leucine-rich repeat protein [Lachnospiraceae bacterium]